ncbi:MAG: hypothetical protein Q9211_004562 [Gyalolechia sp. 1 TL-2023]
MRLPAVLSFYPHLHLLLHIYPNIAQAEFYGIDLTTSYGTIVGSGEHKAKVYGGPSSNVEEIVDKPRQLLRRALKRYGQPPSNDVRILNDLLQNLHRAILGRFLMTGTAFDYALVSFPSLPGLYEEDILDGLFCYGILPETAWISVTPYEAYNHPHTALAAYAGYGFGLCRNDTHVEACEEEESGMMERAVYAIEYTNTSIHAVLSRMSVAELAYEPYDPARTRTSLDLGYASLDARPDDDVYWIEVATFLAQLPRDFEAEGPIEVVNFVGDGMLPGSPRRDKFSDIARQVVRDFQNKDPIVRDDDPEFAAAKGARELARRWIMKHPKKPEGAVLPIDISMTDQIVLVP